MRDDDAYDDYYDSAKKDGEVIQGKNGGQIDVFARALMDCPLCHGDGVMFNAPCSAESCGYWADSVAEATGRNA